jgi:hypothetical protein
MCCIELLKIASVDPNNDRVHLADKVAAAAGYSLKTTDKCLVVVAQLCAIQNQIQPYHHVVMYAYQLMPPL